MSRGNQIVAYPVLDYQAETNCFATIKDKENETRLLSSFLSSSLPFFYILFCPILSDLSFSKKEEMDLCLYS